MDNGLELGVRPKAMASVWGERQTNDVVANDGLCEDSSGYFGGTKMNETIKFVEECPKKEVCVHSNICLKGNYDGLSTRTPYSPLYVSGPDGYYVCASENLKNENNQVK